MSRVAAAGSYRAVLTLPSALRSFAPALVGRLAYGLFPLATLFTVRQATGSYTAAGVAVALFGLASLTLPAKARLIDRRGQRAVLPPLAAVCATALATATLIHDPIPLVALLTVAGLAAPPLGPAMRSTWRRLTEGTDLKERAYALDAVAEETLYLAGPLLTGLLISVAPAAVALLTTAALLLAGSLGMATAPTARPETALTPASMVQPDTALTPTERPAPAPTSVPAARPDSTLAPPPADDASPSVGAGSLWTVGLVGVLAAVLVAGIGISGAFTAAAVVAQSHGRPGAAGLIEGAVGAGSVVGGLLWARRRHRRGHSLHLAGLLGSLGLGLLVASAVPGLLGLGVVLGLTGLVIAPIYVVAYLAADDTTVPGRRTEAGTWVNVANNAGSAAGAAAAGILADTRGPAQAFLVVGVLLLITAPAVARRHGR